MQYFKISLSCFSSVKLTNTSQKDNFPKTEVVNNAGDIYIKIIIR